MSSNQFDLPTNDGSGMPSSSSSNVTTKHSEQNASTKRSKTNKSRSKRNPPSKKDGTKPNGHEGQGDTTIFPGVGCSNNEVRYELLVSSEEFMSVCDQWYTQIINAKPVLADRLPRACWLHICRLFWTGRIEKVVFATTGVKPNSPVRVPIPSNVQVPQPIWEMLKSLGRVKNSTTGHVYIPQTVLPNAAESVNWSDEYEDALAECVAQDWAQSWIDAQHALEAIREVDDNIDDADNREMTPKEMLDMYGRLLDVIKAIINERIELHQPGDDPDDDNEPDEPYYKYRNNYFTEHDFPQLFDVNAREEYLVEVRQELRRWKKLVQSWKPTRPFEVKPVQFRFLLEVADDEINFGSWLGWSPELWHRYEAFANEAKQIAMFSLSFPNEVEGSMAWVLPVKSETFGDVAMLPTADISPNAIQMAIVLKSATWQYSKLKSLTDGWILASDAVGDRQGGIIKWLLKSISTPAQVAPNYY